MNVASMDNWTMAQLRAECAKLGITPGRSKVETVTRIMEARAGKRPALNPVFVARAAEPPRMSRTMRMLADCTAICGTLARNPLIYTGDEDRHDYAIMGGWLVAVALQVRGQWMARQPRPAARRFA